MRAITVRQPWAWAIVHGGKDVENRSRNIAGSYRGLIAIHAGLADYEQGTPAGARYKELYGGETPTEIVFGAIIGVVDLVDVHSADACYEAGLTRIALLRRDDPAAFAALRARDGAAAMISQARSCSRWAQDVGWHLRLSNPRPLKAPVPYRGQLGLWTLPDDVADRVLAGAA